MNIFICSPYRGDVKRNTEKAIAYGQAAARDGHTPYAPHLHFPLLLDDEVPEQRNRGIEAGLKWLRDCDEVWVYGQPTEGMRREIAETERLGKKVVRRDG